MNTGPEIPLPPSRYLLGRHPWLLVIVAFLLLMTAWGTFIFLSAGMPTHKLTPAEEMRLLETGRSQP